MPARRWREACALAGEAIVPDGRPITARHDYCQALRAPQGTVVEIHRWLCPRGLFTIDHQGLFARAVEHRPTAEDTLLTLVVHAAKHGFRLPLRAVVDTRRVVERLRPDGKLVASRALAWGAARATLAWLERCGVADLVAPHLAGVGAAPTEGTGRLLGILLATDRPRRAVSFVSQRLVLHAADALWRLAGVRA